MGNLTALSIKSAPPGKHEDGDGLRLIKREDGGGQWVFRYTLYGRRREMGLGGLKALSLRDARDLASEYRTSVAKGLCCAKLVWDSHCDSSDIAERHVQACPKPLPHPELVCLQRVAA